MMKKCINCRILLKIKRQKKYCSNQCQQKFQYRNYIKKWKAGIFDGTRGIYTKNPSCFLKKYLMIKFGNRCSECGWNKIHPVTGKIPLEIDHINGDGDDNSEDNLRILCPNCHSLTPGFRALNKGRGRVWRKIKYLKNV